jgi:hypothetical protein
MSIADKEVVEDDNMAFVLPQSIWNLLSNRFDLRVYVE